MCVIIDTCLVFRVERNMGRIWTVVIFSLFSKWKVRTRVNLHTPMYRPDLSGTLEGEAYPLRLNGNLVKQGSSHTDVPALVPIFGILGIPKND